MAAVLSAMVGTGRAGVAAQEAPFSWSGTLAAGKVLEVQGISGSIRAEAASGSEARVTAKKHGRSGDFGDVEIRAVPGPDGVTICAVYYPEDHEDDGCGLRDGRSRHDGHRGSIRVEVDYVVELPAGVELDAAMVNGDVEVENVRSRVSATSVNGDVFISTTETAWARTVSGSLDVTLGSNDWRDLSFKTVSGDITLTLPSDLETRVDFESLSGDLDSDFDLVLQDQHRHRWVGARIRGSIGGEDGGGRSLSLSTVSGDVRIRKAR
jgi:hypothetical protein